MLLVAERKLKLFTYGLESRDGLDVTTHMASLALLREFGFPVNPNVKHCQNVDEVIEYVLSWAEKRFELPYETDGMVVKVNAS